MALEEMIRKQTLEEVERALQARVESLEHELTIPSHVSGLELDSYMKDMMALVHHKTEAKICLSIVRYMIKNCEPEIQFPLWKGASTTKPATE